MTYSELLWKVLDAEKVCDNNGLCSVCPYHDLLRKGVDPKSGRLYCITEFNRDEKALRSIMKYLDKIQEEAKENG